MEVSGIIGRIVMVVAVNFVRGVPEVVSVEVRLVLVWSTVYIFGSRILIFVVAPEVAFDGIGIIPEVGVSCCHVCLNRVVDEVVVIVRAWCVWEGFAYVGCGGGNW